MSTFLVAMSAFARTPDQGNRCIVIEAEDMDGTWGRGMAFGASGSARAANGSALSKTVALQAGDYRVYIRTAVTPSQHGTFRVEIGGESLSSPSQGHYYRVGWVPLGRVTVAGGETRIAVGAVPPHSPEVLDAIALSGDSLCDSVGRSLEFERYMLAEVRRATSRQVSPGSAVEARNVQRRRRALLFRAIGLDPLPPRTPLKPIVTGKIDRGDYTIEKVAFESRPSHVVPALLYVPNGLASPAPAVVGTIGHWSSGKSSEFPQLRAIGLAKLGYVVLNFDPCYAWERRIPGNAESSDPFISGGAIAGHQVWDTMRAVDYLATRSEVDAKRIAVTGASGGGQQALYAGALDERIAAVAPAVYVWSFNDITARWGYSIDNWIPGALLNGDIGSTLAIIAPRPLLVLSVTDDYVPLDGSAAQVRMARPFYSALGAPDRLVHSISPGDHGYHKPMREALYGFLARWLKHEGNGAPIAEPPLDPLPENSPELFVFPGGKIPAEGAATVRSIWTDKARSTIASLPAVDPALPMKLRDLLRLSPRTMPSAREIIGGLLLETAPGVKAAARLEGSGERAIISVSDSPYAPTVPLPIPDRSLVLAIQPRSISLPADRGLANQAAILLHKPLPGIWAEDILAAFDYLRNERKVRSISIVASGRYAGLAALFATVLEPSIEHTRIEGLFPSFLDVLGRDPVIEIPGILRVGDIPQLARSAGPGRIVLTSTN